MWSTQAVPGKQWKSSFPEKNNQAIHHKGYFICESTQWCLSKPLVCQEDLELCANKAAQRLLNPPLSVADKLRRFSNSAVGGCWWLWGGCDFWTDVESRGLKTLWLGKWPPNLEDLHREWLQRSRGCRILILRTFGGNLGCLDTAQNGESAMGWELCRIEWVVFG